MLLTRSDVYTITKLGVDIFAKNINQYIENKDIEHLKQYANSILPWIYRRKLAELTRLIDNELFECSDCLVKLAIVKANKDFLNKITNADCFALQLELLNNNINLDLLKDSPYEKIYLGVLKQTNIYDEHISNRKDVKVRKVKRIINSRSKEDTLSYEEKILRFKDLYKVCKGKIIYKEPVLRLMVADENKRYFGTFNNLANRGVRVSMTIDNIYDNKMTDYNKYLSTLREISKLRDVLSKMDIRTMPEVNISNIDLLLITYDNYLTKHNLLRSLYIDVSKLISKIEKEMKTT